MSSLSPLHSEAHLESPNYYFIVPRLGGQIWTWQCIRDRYADWDTYLQLLWMLTHHMMQMEPYLQYNTFILSCCSAD